MSQVKAFAEEALRRKEESVRFSITLPKSADELAASIAEQLDCSKSALCSDLLIRALKDIEPTFKEPDETMRGSLPSLEEYKEAFAAIKDGLTEGHKAMLIAHYKTPNFKTTTVKLAEAAGYKGYGGVNLQLGRIAGLIADYLKISPPKYPSGDPFYSAMLVTWNKEDVWYCTLRPQVVKALEDIGLVNNSKS